MATAAPLKIIAHLLFFLVLSTVFSAAQSDNSSGIEKQLSILQKLQDYNKTVAESTLGHVSFLIAFLAGILSFLAPCTLALFPAFLAYVAKTGRNLTLATTTFFAGFSLSFVALGVILTSVGRISFVTFQQDISVLIRAVGVALIFLGTLTFFGRGFSSIRISSKLPKNALGTFIFGALFAVGWSACIGPVIAGIFTMAAVFHNYAYTALLLFFYALGLAIPLFIASFAYDKFNLANHRIFNLFNINLTVGKSEILITGTNALSGLLLIFLCLFFIVNVGTTAITTADLLGMSLLLLAILSVMLLLHKFAVAKVVASPNWRKIAAVAELLAGVAVFAIITSRFSIRTTGVTEELSRPLLQGNLSLNIIAGIILIFFVAVLFYFLKKQTKKKG
ncbi:MAG TPA: cytochrome c biogenesis CcdA family protein [Candidatus Nanoarchaeia archaeon]|nr:cytochrome c biogenesis CcdA family protein [Candidatus Nanoarchaeia archaeon]